MIKKRDHDHDLWSRPQERPVLTLMKTTPLSENNSIYMDFILNKHGISIGRRSWQSPLLPYHNHWIAWWHSYFFCKCVSYYYVCSYYMINIYMVLADCTFLCFKHFFIDLLFNKLILKRISGLSNVKWTGLFYLIKVKMNLRS